MIDIKNAWSDPVWSKVIAGAITCLAAFLTAHFYRSITLKPTPAWVLALAISIVTFLISWHVILTYQYPIRWNFSGFLGMSASGSGPITIGSLQIQGINTSGRHIETVSGYVRSNLTGDRIPVLLNSIPPEETNGIPPLCTFQVNAMFNNGSEMNHDEFLREFGDFTFVFICDGLKFEHRFSAHENNTMLESFRNQITPPPAVTITRKGR